MFKRTALLCVLVLLLTAAFSSVAFATAPYASIIAYNELISNQGGDGYKSQPNVSTLGVLDIINMTPWNISLGTKPAPMLPGMTTLPWAPFWLAGFNNAPQTGNFGGGFAFHSFQVPLNNLNNAWQLKNKLSGFSQPIFYDSIPLVFNSSTPTQTSNTVALNFIATSTSGFDVSYESGIYNYPATAISFGDGANNYGWASNDTMIYSAVSWKNTTHFLTIQGLGTSANNWKPIVKNLGGSVAHTGVGSSVPGSTVQGPPLLNVSGLAYKNFSAVAGDNLGFDLVVIIQAGGYTDMQLIFLAVPTSNDAFLNGL